MEEREGDIACNQKIDQSLAKICSEATLHFFLHSEYLKIELIFQSLLEKRKNSVVLLVSNPV